MYTTLFQHLGTFFVYLTDEDLSCIAQQQQISCDLCIKISYSQHEKSAFTLKFASPETLTQLHGPGISSIIKRGNNRIELTVSILYAKENLLSISGKRSDELELICNSGEKFYFYAGEGKNSSVWKLLLSRQNKLLS